jgi:hypothetical protein
MPVCLSHRFQLSSQAEAGALRQSEHDEGVATVLAIQLYNSGAKPFIDRGIEGVEVAG